METAAFNRLEVHESGHDDFPPVKVHGWPRECARLIPTAYFYTQNAAFTKSQHRLPKSVICWVRSLQFWFVAEKTRLRGGGILARYA